MQANTFDLKQLRRIMFPNKMVRYFTRKYYRIFMYHSIVKDSSFLHILFPGKYISLSEFEKQMRYVSENYNPVSINQIIHSIRNNVGFPLNNVCITFDDGYLNNYQLAMPILTKYRIPAILFPATAFIDMSLLFWTDLVDLFFSRVDRDSIELPFIEMNVRTDNILNRRRSADIVKNCLKQMHSSEHVFIEFIKWLNSETIGYSGAIEHQPMTWDNIRNWRSSGFDVGAHTVTHPSLKKISIAKAKAEIINSRKRLESELQMSIDVFAFPYGSINDLFDGYEVFLKSEGFMAAVSTIPGLVSTDRNMLYHLNRYEGKQEFHDFVAHVSGVQFILSKIKAAIINK